MKIYLDTADPAATQRLLGTGLFSGVTCNPVILKSAGLTPATARRFYDTAVGAGAQQVFLQTFGGRVDAMLAQGLRYRELGPEIVVKVPCTVTGLAVAFRLEQQRVPALLAAVHDAKQTLGAMAAGASYVAPYLSEMYAAGRHDTEQVLSMLRMLRADPGKTELVMAGFQDISTMVTLAEAGMQYMSITPAIADMLFAQPETEAISAFFDEASAA